MAISLSKVTTADSRQLWRMGRGVFYNRRLRPKALMVLSLVMFSVLW